MVRSILQFFINRIRSLWSDPQRRFGFLLLGSVSLITLPLCWYLPLFLFPSTEESDSARFWLFLGRGVLLGLIVFALLLYFRIQDLRRDWDFSLRWFHNLILGYDRSPAIRDLYGSLSYGLLFGAGSWAGIVAALELMLLWEIFFLLLLLGEWALDPSGALLASPGARAKYFLILGKRVPVSVAAAAGGAAFAGTLKLGGDLYLGSQTRKTALEVAQIHSNKDIAVAQIELDTAKYRAQEAQIELDTAKYRAQEAQIQADREARAKRWWLSAPIHFWSGRGA